MKEKGSTAENPWSSLLGEIIKTKLENESNPVRYRAPLIGFADARNPLFGDLKRVAHPDHALPEELLNGARTVMSFFLPFDGELVRQNRRHSYVSREWVEAYVFTNQLIKDICGDIAAELEVRGFRSGWELPTHNFDPVRLVSPWSHKHIAYICGLGSFGLNTLLVTDLGCAGRFGSLVTDAVIEPVYPVRQLFLSGCDKCRFCIKACPVSALGDNGLDKAACYARLLEVDRYYSDLPTCDACGKCSNGPCSLAKPREVFGDTGR